MAPSKSELIDSAQRNAQRGQLDKAIKDYQQALQIDSGDIQTRLRLGDVFAKKGATREAIEQYSRVAERHSGDGFYLKAIAVHKQILKLDASHIESSSRLADLYHKQGLLSDALATYRQVAAVYDRQGAVREALDTLTKMADLDPQNVAIRVKLGELYLKASIKESGIEQLLKAAALYGQSGKTAEQGRILETILAAGPTSPASTRAVIAALIAAGQLEPALARVDALVARSPGDPELRELQAEACLRAGHVDKAAEALAAAVENSPQRIEARRRLVELRLDAGDEAGAAAVADGFTPESVPPNRLDAAAAAVSALVARQPAPPAAVRVALYRQLAALHGARKDAAGREAALAALADAAGETVGAGGGAWTTVDGSVDFALEGTLDQPAPACPTPPPAAAMPQDEAELTIEIDDAVEAAPVESSLEMPEDTPADLALGDAQPLEGRSVEAVVDMSGVELTVDGAPDGFGGDVALEPPRRSARGVAPASLPAGMEVDASASFDLSFDLAAGLETAPLDTGVVDAPALDEAPFDTSTIDAPGAGDAAPLEGAGAAARARATGSPEARVLAAGDAELALDQIPEEIDEAEFFVQQGLLDAARAIYKRILAVDPEHPVAQERLERLAKPPAAEPVVQKAGATGSSAKRAAPSPSPARAQAGAKPSSARPEADATEQFDLAAVLAGVGDAPALLENPEEQVSFQEVFREFKKGVERQVGDDPETHYNLGIAYKEMGLVEDAIAEFERALGDPLRSFDCYTMIGLAHLARGDAESAIAAFESGLGHADGNPRQAMALTYELAVAFEAAGRLDAARGAFATVAASDARFRDVAERLVALGGAPAGAAFDPQSLLEDDLSYAAEGATHSAQAGATKPSPARPVPGARPSSVPAAPHSSKRDKISFV